MGLFDWVMKRHPGGKQTGQGAGPAQETWVVRIEHGMLRVVSLVFSLGSAYAIARVFAPHDGNLLRLAVDVAIAGAFGVLGYFLSRSLAYRLMHNQSVWAYVPICLVVELVEVFCNYVMGVSEVPYAAWLQGIPLDQRPVITVLSYVVLSIIPAVSLFLAVADMDLERRKNQPKPPLKAAASSQYQQTWQQQPQRGATAQGFYQQGYGGVQTQMASSAASKAPQNTAANTSPFEGVRRP